MRKLILSIGFIITLISAQAQFHGDNFDGNWPGIGYGDLIYEFDTTSGLNIWQIGEPQKSIFLQAYSMPNALMTDTINPYPINDTSAIIVKAPVWSHDWGAHTIMFQYKLNTDSLSDYGKLEVSGDGGNTYINVLSEWNDYGFWWNGDIVENFTGNTDDWKWFSICVSGLLDSFPSADTIQYRFSFISDGNQTNKDGWIIDDLVVQDVTESIKDINNSSQTICYPNPTNNILIIENKAFENGSYRLEIYNDRGQLLSASNYHIGKIKINLNKYGNGIYFYRIIDNDKKFQTYNKFIMNK